MGQWFARRPRWGLALCLVALFAGAAGAQEPAAETPLTGETANPPPSIADIEAALEQVQQSKELDEEAKEKIVKIYKQALVALQNADKFRAQAREFEQLRVSAPQRGQELKDQLAKPAPEYMVPKHQELSRLEQERADAQAQLDSAVQVLSEANGEADRRTQRRAALPKLIEERTRDLAELDKQLAATESAADEQSQAARSLLLAQRLAAEQEINAARKEQQAYDAVRDLLPLQRDKATVDVKRLQKKVQLLTEEINRRRRNEAARQARLARSAAAQQSYPTLKEIAEQNRKLAEERAGPDGIVARIEDVSQQTEEVRERLEQIRRQFQSVQEKIKKVGLINAVAEVLRRDDATLPDTGKLRRSLRQREDEIAAVRFRQLSVDDMRTELADLNSQVESRMNELTSEGPAPPDVNVEAEMRDLLETQCKYLDDLNADYDTLFVRLSDLSIAEQELIDKTLEYATYIDENILWAASARQLGVSSWSDLQNAANWLLRSATWGRGLNELVRRKPVDGIIILVLMLTVLPLAWLQRRLSSRITACGNVASKKIMDRFAPTVEAFGLTLILSLAWPGMMWLVGRNLTAALAGDSAPAAFGAGLQLAAVAYVPLELMRQVCRPKGLAECHFEWPESALVRLRRRLGSVSVILVPTVAVAGMFAYRGVEAWSDSLGRCAFLVAMISLAAFLESVLRPFGRGLHWHLSAKSHAASARLGYLWYPAVPLIPVALAAMAFMGYYYTAAHLAWNLMATLSLLLALLLAYALVRRWLLVTRRHIAIQQARDRRAQAEQAAHDPSTHAGESAAVGGPDAEVDLSTINVQMSRLARGIIVACGIVGLWFIWVDVLPALGVLRKVTLWQTSAEVVRQSPLEDGSEAVRNITTQVDITLADLGLAILVAMLALIGSRNVPGMIEIFALQKLPMDQGTRYAISTLSSYLISVVGIVVACNILGIGWSQVQWLVAAAAVGLGFGLQEIFANLVSGLMIFFERPIRVGDVVTVGDTTGVVSRVRIRATTITNWDRKEFIIPNKEFITGRVMNWTLSDQVNRIVITVGIAYGSDTQRARDAILRVAQQHPLVLEDPAPTVFFEEFGDSALTFILRAYLPDLQNRLPIIHELHMAIDAALREAQIEVAFPQRDVHVRFHDRLAITDSSNGAPAVRADEAVRPSTT